MTFIKNDVRYARAGSWLVSLYETISFDQPVRTSSLLQILVGSWICKSDVYMLAKQTQHYLDKQYKNDDLDFITCDFALSLVSLSIMRSLDVECRAIESFAYELADTLEHHVDSNPAETLDLFLPRTLLYNLGMYPEPDPPSIDSFTIPNGLNLFQTSDNIIKSLAVRIGAATIYGRRKLNKEMEELSIVVPVWMLHAFKRYNIEVGTLLLRTMKYLNIQNNRSFETGLYFVLAQQHPDGHFGYFAQEASKIQSSHPDFDELHDLYLPITLSSLWTIAEANSNFRLFQKI